MNYAVSATKSKSTMTVKRRFGPFATLSPEQQKIVVKYRLDVNVVLQNWQHHSKWPYPGTTGFCWKCYHQFELSIHQRQRMRKHKIGHGLFCSKRCANFKIGQQNATKLSATMRTKNKAIGYRYIMHRHEHRVVMEQKLGRTLRSDEIVHYKDGIVHNNHPNNLELMTRSEHARLHMIKIWAAKR